MRWMVAAAAALMLAACGQGGTGPQLPPVQEGAQAPSQQTPAGPAQQANITAEMRTSLTANVNQMLAQMQQQQGGEAVASIPDQIMELQPGTDHRQQVALTGGTGYRIDGACDGDCTNLDIELIDVRTGGVVASDMLPDDFPIVSFTPPADGQYIVRTMMQACSVAPCFAGTRVVTTGAGASSAGK